MTPERAVNRRRSICLHQLPPPRAAQSGAEQPDAHILLRNDQSTSVPPMHMFQMFSECF
jgi:hypothetical protein